MEEEDTDMYSSPYKNFLRIVETISVLESGRRLSEDWFEEHKKHILNYRNEFPNFHKVNEDIGDSEFRKKASETEVILSSLVHEVKTRQLFNTKMYLLLNKHMKELVEIIWGEDELSEMLGRMGM